MRNMIIVNNLTILFVGIMLVIFLGRLFTKPILALTKATHQVAEGDFDVALPPERDDEIGELISSFGTMLKRLQSTELLRTNFITDISHEFKTPLTSIKGYTPSSGCHTRRTGALHLHHHRGGRSPFPDDVQHSAFEQAGPTGTRGGFHVIFLG